MVYRQQFLFRLLSLVGTWLSSWITTTCSQNLETVGILFAIRALQMRLGTESEANWISSTNLKLDGKVSNGLNYRAPEPPAAVQFCRREDEICWPVARHDVLRRPDCIRHGENHGVAQKWGRVQESGCRYWLSRIRGTLILIAFGSQWRTLNLSLWWYTDDDYRYTNVVSLLFNF